MKVHNKLGGGWHLIKLKKVFLLILVTSSRLNQGFWDKVACSNIQWASIKPNMYKFVPVGHKMALHNCELDLVNWNFQSTLPAIVNFLLQIKKNSLNYAIFILHCDMHYCWKIPRNCHTGSKCTKNMSNEKVKIRQISAYWTENNLVRN